MSIPQIGLLSLLIGQIAYLFLSLFFVYGLVRGITGRAALGASVLTFGWLVSISLLGFRPATHLLESFAYLGWIFLLARILGITLSSYCEGPKAWPFWLTVSAACIVGFLLLSDVPGTEAAMSQKLAYAKLALALVGLVMLEQVTRNTRRDSSWNLKYVGIGLGILFLYAFVLYTDAVLFRSLNQTLLLLQPAIYALAVPFLAIASLRNRSNRMNVNVSRQFVFRSGVLIAAGTYLLLMGFAGYYVRFFGGHWGEVFQVLILSVGLIVLVVVASSSQVRNYLRVALLRNLYEYKYDYRDEWIRVTQELSHSDPDESLASLSIRALGDIVHANQGGYWRRSEVNTLVPVEPSKVQWRRVLTPAVSDSLIRFCEDKDWIIDIQEYRETPTSYRGLNLEPDFTEIQEARFIVPLMIERTLFGVIVLKQPEIPMHLIWEDYDILKIIARQAAAFLAMQHTSQILSESKQLHALHQLSAFLVHDLKTISAQLSLLLKNAEKHKDNPRFISDMLQTTENSVSRMNHMLNQLRDQAIQDGDDLEVLDLIALVQGQLKRSGSQLPVPEFRCSDHSIRIEAEAEKLESVLGHILQNARDATPDDGSIVLTLKSNEDWATLAIEDTGTGMTQDFIDSKLFAPFVSTKGLSGMGIGVYQAREYVRSIGGDVGVSSRPGEGTTFLIRIPLFQLREVAQA